MSRRKAAGEQEFGSDSFLDIIANIVGILIILIVVAGMKVARQAEQTAAELAAAVAASEEAIELTKDTSIETAPTAWPWKPQPEAAEIAATEESLGLSIPGLAEQAANPFTVSEVPFDFGGGSADATPEKALEAAEVEQQVAALNAELAETLRMTASSEEELQQLLDLLELQKQDESLRAARQMSIHQRQSELTERVLQLQEEAIAADTQSNSLRAVLASNSNRQNYVKNALREVAQQTMKLREVLDERESETIVEDRLNHRLSPVGKNVQPGEDALHFYLHNDHISHVPLKVMANNALAAMKRRAHLIGNKETRGKVPVSEGFELTYLMEKLLKDPSVRQHYSDRYWVKLSATIRPTDTIRSEPIDSALRIGSRFRQLVETAPLDSTIIIWVYPGDFKHFRRLREFGHSLDLRVAAEPLSEGDFIDISFNGGGRRSVAQ